MFHSYVGECEVTVERGAWERFVELLQPAVVGEGMFSELVRQMYREGEFGIGEILNRLNHAVSEYDMERARVYNEQLMAEHGLSVSLIAKGSFEDVRVALVVANPKAEEYAKRHLSSPLWNTGVPWMWRAEAS